MLFMSTMTNGRPAAAHADAPRRHARGACTTRASSTKSPAGAMATSRSTTPVTSRSIRPRIPRSAIDLKELVDRLQLRGISLPVLIRFTDILKHRLGDIHAAFQTAITQHQYQGGYSCVYPIKVNQQRQVVEEVHRFRQAVQLRPRGRLQARAARSRRDRRQRRRRSSATASRTPSSSRRRCWASRSAATSFRSSRSTPNWDSSSMPRKRSACGRRSACV